jgi:hypothetical protein
MPFDLSKNKWNCLIGEVFSLTIWSGFGLGECLSDFLILHFFRGSKFTKIRLLYLLVPSVIFKSSPKQYTAGFLPLGSRSIVRIL